MGTSLDTALLEDPPLAARRRVALLHHPPVVREEEGFVGQVRTWALAMKGADNLLRWLANRDVSLVLHGHQHRKRNVEATVDTARGTRTITLIGCAASLGAGDLPLSYDLVMFDPGTSLWKARFLEDTSDGNGFVDKEVPVLRYSVAGEARGQRRGWPPLPTRIPTAPPPGPRSSQQ